MTDTAATERRELERFLCDMSDCVDGGDLCKAKMRTSVAGAFVYHSAYVQLEAERDALMDRLNKAEWLASVIWLHYREREDLDPCQQKHLELANHIRAARDMALGETIQTESQETHHLGRR